LLGLPLMEVENLCVRKHARHRSQKAPAGRQQQQAARQQQQAPPPRGHRSSQSSSSSSSIAASDQISDLVERALSCDREEAPPRAEMEQRVSVQTVKGGRIYRTTVVVTPAPVGTTADAEADGAPEEAVPPCSAPTLCVVEADIVKWFELIDHDQAVIEEVAGGGDPPALESYLFPAAMIERFPSLRLYAGETMGVGEGGRATGAAEMYACICSLSIMTRSGLPSLRVHCLECRQRRFTLREWWVSDIWCDHHVCWTAYCVLTMLARKARMP
jgi:hypothetical protein